MHDGDLSERLYFGTSNGFETVGTIPFDCSVYIAEDEPLCAEYDFWKCRKAMSLQPVKYEAHIDWAKGADMTKVIGLLPGTPTPVTLMFERKLTHRILPRTVREAKARRKGNRGNRRRRKVTYTIRQTLPNVRVDYSCDFSAYPFSM